MPDEAKFLSDIQSDNADVRFAAWRQAGEAPPSTIPRLGKLAASEKPGVAKAAREALTTMVHSVGKDPAAPNRAAVVKGLLDISAKSYSLPVRVLAFRLLSNIAGEDSTDAVARSLTDTDVREEAIYALERIPGNAPLRAIVAAYKDAKDDFKPRILAALGHRRAADAVPLCVEAMRSSNKELAVAGMKAFGRIGKKPGGRFPEPDASGLNWYQNVDRIDSLLRYADAQAKEGNTVDAIRIYKTALEQPEEHWQCAGIIGLSKLGTADAAVAIFPKMKSANRNVRITAENAWKKMATA